MRRLAPLLAALAAWAIATTDAHAATNPTRSTGQAALAILQLVPEQFTPADLTHNATAAARVRTLAAIAAAGVGADPSLQAASAPATRLVRRLRATRVRLQPWPLPQTVSADSAAAVRALRTAGVQPATTTRPYGSIHALLTAATDATAHGQTAVARLDAAGAYALFARGLARRLNNTNPALGDQTTNALWHLVTAAGRPGGPAGARNEAESDLQTAATALGDATVSRATIIADAGVIVFREGLEAVLILAAITASFTGTRRRLRRPVLIGGLVGLAATAVTYQVATTIVSALGDGGLRLQAITGLVAIAVLLIVTNWFFHRIYWSEWIGRFNRRRRTLEQIDRLGFISGQTLGFVLLGLTSVYREGFETVLFLQNLQVSAGTTTTIIGVGIGLAATALVGTATFALERKLPYRKMLIATGVLIGLVLAIMVGTTIHNLQGLDWIPTSPTSFQLDLAWGRWLGLYPTWEGIGAQLGALAVVYGSYALARALLKHRRRRTGPRSGLVTEPQSIREH